MKILDDLVSTLNLEAEVRDMRQGPFRPPFSPVAAGWRRHPMTTLTTRTMPR